jgi:hypothetical protein
VRDFSEITDTISVLFMWHTLEHLPDPTAFWTQHSNKLADDAIIFLQIPLYRPQHVVRSHYVFYTEKSLTQWAAALSAVPLHFGYDTENSFLAMIARRNRGT